MVLRCETVCLGFHWAIWKWCSLADTPPGVLIPSDQNLSIINALLHSDPGSAESAVGHPQREDKMTIRKATLEQRGTGCGAALSDTVELGTQLREINVALRNLLELTEILVICIES